MKEITRQELSKYKILPFNIYNEAGEVILKAGDALSIGKILQLKVYDKIFIDFTSSDNEKNKDETKDVPLESNKKADDDSDDDFDYKSMNVVGFKTPINKYSALDEIDQKKLIMFFSKTVDLLSKKSIKDAFPKIATLSEIIIKEVLPKLQEANHYSELRLLGDYEKCHPINVAIMAGMVAQKMDLEKDFVSDIILAGILHDIGKYRIPNAFHSLNSISVVDAENLKKHTVVGYNILKNELKLAENVCKVALQHHEHNDGTGYPHGISSDWISIESQIVNVCNCYDNFAFNKTGYIIKNNRDVLRLMLSIGTKGFSAEVLYTFIHMFSYNDIVNFNDMTENSA